MLYLKHNYARGTLSPLNPLPKGMIPFGILRLLRSIF